MRIGVRLCSLTLHSHTSPLSFLYPTPTPPRTPHTCRYLDWADALEEAAPKDKGKGGKYVGADAASTYASVIAAMQSRRSDLARLFAQGPPGASGAEDVLLPGPGAYPIIGPNGGEAPLTPEALRAHAAQYLPDLSTKMRVAYGDCRLTRQLQARAELAAQSVAH